MPESMTSVERVRMALAMQEAGYTATPTNEEMADLLWEYDRLRTALIEMRDRDDRNGSLHQNYRNIIDKALAEHV